MLVRCTACKNELQAPDSAAGMIIKCPACGQKLRLPEAPADCPTAPLPAPSRPRNRNTGGGFSDGADVRPKYASRSDADIESPSRKRKCPACGERVSRDDDFCPFCDEELWRAKKGKTEDEPLYDEAWMRSGSDELELHDYIIAILFPFFILICCWLAFFLMSDKGPKFKKMSYVSLAALVFYLLLFLIIKAFE